MLKALIRSFIKDIKAYFLVRWYAYRLKCDKVKYQFYDGWDVVDVRNKAKACYQDALAQRLRYEIADEMKKENNKLDDNTTST